MLRTTDATSEATKGTRETGSGNSGEAAIRTLLSELQLEARRAWHENRRVLDLRVVRLRISAGRALLSLAVAGLFWSALLALTLLATLQLLRAVEIAVAGTFGPAYGLLASVGVGLGLVALGVGFAVRRGVCRARASLAGVPSAGSHPAGSPTTASGAPLPATRPADGIH
jgi:hypothetical protein